MAHAHWNVPVPHAFAVAAKKGVCQSGTGAERFVAITCQQTCDRIGAK
jgi:hypothetical protein